MRNGKKTKRSEQKRTLNYPFGEGTTRPDQKARARCKEAGGTWQDGKCIFPKKPKKETPPPSKKPGPANDPNK